MKFSDEILMAYADGELDAATRAAIDEQMRNDPQLAQQVARHRALRAKLGDAFGDVLAEGVPERLVATAQTAPAGNNKIIDLAAARDARMGVTRRWSASHWTAVAASLVIGIVGTLMALQREANPIVADNGRMTAAGVLALALDNQPGGVPGAGPAQIGISFVAKGGNYCRTFSVGGADPRAGQLAGMACREANAWRVKALAEGNTPAGGDYRMAASSLPPSVLRAVEDSMAGEALDAAGEAAARQRGWKK